jgi:hypothetical protein
MEDSNEFGVLDIQINHEPKTLQDEVKNLKQIIKSRDE